MFGFRKKKTAKQLLELGVQRKREGDFEAAKKMYLESITIDPLNVMGYYSLAKTCYLTQERKLATINYLRSLHLSLRNQWNRHKQGHREEMQVLLSQVKTKDDQEALARLQKHHEVAPFLLLQQNITRHLAHAFIDLNQQEFTRLYESVLSGTDGPEKCIAFMRDRIERYRSSISGALVETDEHWETVTYDRIALGLAVSNIDWTRMTNNADVRAIYPEKMVLKSSWTEDELCDESGDGGMENVVGTTTEEPDLRRILDSARRGDAAAQVELGIMRLEGRGVARDASQAVVWWRRAAAQDHPRACFNLGVAYENGIGVKQDDREAVGWYRRAAEHGIADAQNNLGGMYSNGCGVAKDEKRAIAWYRQAAEQNFAPSQFNLGKMYEDGRGVTQDDRQAVAWYRRAAEQGNAGAQNNLGQMYEDGRGVTQDDRQAVAWYRRAAEQGYAIAQSNLASMYLNGCGVAQDDHQAATWYRRAADQGNGVAQIYLGGMYEYGRGVAQDDHQAATWYRRAAEQGIAEAQFNLGGMYLNGCGVVQDDRQAVFWLSRAADQGVVEAGRVLDILRAKGRC